MINNDYAELVPRLRVLLIELQDAARWEAMDSGIAETLARTIDSITRLVGLLELVASRDENSNDVVIPEALEEDIRSKNRTEMSKMLNRMIADSELVLSQLRGNRS